MPAFSATDKQSTISADGRVPALAVKVVRGAPVNPLAITDLTITTTDTVATYHFTPPAEVNTNYLLQVATGTTWGGDRYFSAASGEDGEHDYTGLTAGGVHKGRIFVNGVVSNTVDFTMQAAVPISDFTATTTETTATYNFTRKTGTVNYTFQWSLNGGASWTGNILIAASSLPAGPYTRSDLTEGSAYLHRVLADGTPSNVVDEPTKAAEVVTPPPSGTFAASFDPEQVVPTFAQATHYASPTAVTNGSGTLGSPWTFAQAMANAAPGNIVGLLPGQWYGTEPAVAAEQDKKFTPAFRPSNSGTKANPIWYVAQYPAATNATNRTEIYSGATVARVGWPAFGAYNKNYVRFVGFYTNQNNPNNQYKDDSGASILWSQTGGGVYKCHIVGVNNPYDNNAGVRVENSKQTEVADNVVEGFLGTNVGVTTPGTGGVNNAFVQSYLNTGLRIHHNTISNCLHALHIKTKKNGFKFYNNKITTCKQFIRVSTPGYTDEEDQAWVYNNIADNLNFIFESTTSDGFYILQKLKIFNNTFNDVTRSFNDPAPIWWASSPPDIDRDNSFVNNIIHTARAYMGSYQGNPNTMAKLARFIKANRNVIHNLTNGLFAGSALSSYTLAQWQAAGQDTNSVFANPLFTDRPGKDFTLQAGSPAVGLGRDIYGAFGPVDGVINTGARPLSSSEIIGVRP